jgi:hypothetical protein
MPPQSLVCRSQGSTNGPLTSLGAPIVISRVAEYDRPTSRVCSFGRYGHRIERRVLRCEILHRGRQLEFNRRPSGQATRIGGCAAGETVARD